MKSGIANALLSVLRDAIRNICEKQAIKHSPKQNSILYFISII